MKEIEKALEELGKAVGDEVYKMAGGIFVKRNKEDIKKELEEKLETLKLRVSTLTKQEEKMQKRLSELQEKLQQAITSTAAQ
ncbi:Prefoldin beta- domain protein [Methanotorris formicicus Mc-S-70]|uniref:Prefoldin subunit beta n=2 Tax=Methanotorris formicicus TaxID=213185 RepID=H1KYZ4_9EURY|nr:Prefoldin beta- domain protein [Methanotorris formicicus Mc-S-70]